MALISRDKFIRALWQLGFEYVTSPGVRTTGFWRGDALYIEVPRVEEIDLEWARSQLRRCEVSEEEIDDALR